MSEKSWAESYWDGEREFVAEVMADPWKRKVYNFIRNDFRGILNSVDERFSFKYNDWFEDRIFLLLIIMILHKYQFHEVRYDKKALANHFKEVFNDMCEKENFKVGRKQESINEYMVDRELRLFIAISKLYKNYL